MSFRELPGDPSFGCRWEYLGQPCEVRGVIIEETADGKSEVVGMAVSVRGGPTIAAMFDDQDLAYEVKES